MATQDFNVTSTLTPSGAPTLSRYAQRVAARRARRLNPSPQAKAARQRAALRRHEDAALRLNRLDTLAMAGDAVALHVLEASYG